MPIMKTSHLLDIPENSIRSLRLWLLVAVLSLAVAGVFSIAIVLARTPHIASAEFLSKIFHTSLVVHVDLSVLVWFLSFAVLFWQLLRREDCALRLPYFSGSGVGCMVAGTFLMALSPLNGGETLMSNYIPVLTNPLFFISLGLVFAGIIVSAVEIIAQGLPRNPIEFGIWSSIWIVLFSFFGFALSAKGLSAHGLGAGLVGREYYDSLFWGGGHLLQFAHTQLLVVAWLWLAALMGSQVNIADSLLKILFAIGLVVVLLLPVPYWLYAVDDWAFRNFFTQMMRMGNGIAPLVVAPLVVVALYKARKSRDYVKMPWIYLSMSWLLFAFGGVFGALITVENVQVPAHYHGSIVGISLAFMGIACSLLPKLGLADVSNWRLARLQPVIYGFGQIMHISGLAISGGYGVLRKTPGEVPASAKIAMGVMGMGGLLAIIGGLIFVLLMWKAWVKRPQNI